MKSGDWHNRGFCLEGFPSGQRDQTVNLTALPSKVRILPPPPMNLALLEFVCGRFDWLALWQSLVRAVALVELLLVGGTAGVAQW